MVILQMMWLKLQNCIFIALYRVGFFLSFFPQIVSQVDVATSIITLADHGSENFTENYQKKRCEINCYILTLMYVRP